MEPEGCPLPRPEAVLFDLDGTLYDERAVRRAMLPRLALGALLGGGPRLLRTVQAYRTAREELRGHKFPTGDVLAEAHRVLASERARVAGGELTRVTEDWLEKRPLRAVGRAARPGLRELFQWLGASGVRVGVFSDHPVEGKLEALGVRELVNCHRSAFSPDVGAFKPAPEGFLRLAQDLGLEPEKCWVVGDRDDCDGAAADAAGMRFLLVGNRPAAPHRQRLSSLSDLQREIERA